MKKIILSLLIILVTNNFYAQVNIGKSKSWANIYVSELSNKQFDEIKNLKTIFVIPNGLDKDTIKQIIDEVWTINDIKFIAKNNFEASKFSNNAVIELIDDEGFKKRIKRTEPYNGSVATGLEQQKDKTIGEYIVFNFSLFIPSQKKAVAQIFFTPNIKKREVITNSSDRKSALEKALIKNKQKKNKEISGFYNFDLGYIKNYFQCLNENLNNNINIQSEDTYVDENEIKNLKESTLFTPDWMMKRYDPFSSTIKKIDKPEKYFSKYNYDYKVITNKDLNEKILEGKDDFYYLMHTQVNGDKIVSVINGKTGNIIYRKTTRMSYNIKSKDISFLNKQIN
ncbi:MAG: hypothetical protein HRT69_03975 [Flavobacteriaceae bacterium]|nr:hypothetical protein [Flavobacteriaceae bacterium]